MELFGLLLAVPVTLVTSLVFCLWADGVLRRSPHLRRPAAIASSIIVGTGLLEVAATRICGAPWLHQHLKATHGIIHLVNVVFAPPAVASLILLARPAAGWRSVVVRVAAVGLCWLTCMVALLGHVTVHEAIYGIDGVPPVVEQIGPDAWQAGLMSNRTETRRQMISGNRDLRKMREADA